MKPLVVFDIETTGTEKTGNDWIIQFAAIKVDRDTHKVIDKINQFIRPNGKYVMAIGAYLAHRIHPDFLKDKPTFPEVAERIRSFFDGCDILTYNGIQFDLPFLAHEFKRCGIIWDPTSFVCYDSFLTEVKRHSHTLHDTFERYCGRTMEDAGLQPHDGMSDVKATYAIFRHQNETAPVEPEKMITDDDKVIIVDYEGEDVYAFNFGKYKKIPIKIVKLIDEQYIKWVLTTELCDKSRKIINDELNVV